MKYYREYYPAKPLADYIECYWVLRCSPHELNERELIIPGGRVELLFNLGSALHWFRGSFDGEGDRYTESIIVGQRDRFYHVGFASVAHVVGVRFKAGGFSSYTRTPLAEIQNKILSVDCLLQKDFRFLAEKLSGIASEERMINELEKMLLASILSTYDSKQILSAVKLIHHSPDIQAIDRITKETGIHYKALERKFLRYVGYTPKTYTRILRFYRTAKQLLEKNKKLTCIGLENGYFDQSHFIREIKSFTGLSPKKFQQRDNQMVNILLRKNFQRR